MACLISLHNYFLFLFFQEKPKPGKHNVVKRYHSQYYVNGSECDLTGKARETQIKVVFMFDIFSNISVHISIHASVCQLISVSIQQSFFFPNFAT